MQEQLSRPNTRFPIQTEEAQAVQIPVPQQTLGTGFFEIKVDEPIPEKIQIKNKVVEERIENKSRAQSNGNEAAIFISNADLLMKHGETALASHLIRQCLYLNSSHPEALKRLAVCLTKPEDLPIKIKAFQTLLGSEMNFENMARLGHCHYQANQDQKAREIYMEALSTVTEESKELFEVYKNMGNIFLKEADFDNAEEFYNKAFTISPKSDVLLVNLGTLALQQQQLDLALNRFREALEINARNDKAWVGLALGHNAMGDLVLSRANLENALDVNPKNRTAVHLAATWAVRDQDESFAIQALENFLSEVDCDEEMSLLLIHLFCVRNQYVEALLEIERLLLWNPADPRLQQIEQEIRNAQKK